MTTNRLTPDDHARVYRALRPLRWSWQHCPVCGCDVTRPGLCDKCAPLVAAGKAREVARDDATR